MNVHDNHKPNVTARSFEAMLLTYKNMLYRLCNRYSSRELAVEDLMQEVALALWDQREKLWSVPDGVQRKSWIWKVARNTAIDQLRKTRLHLSLEETDATYIPDEDNSLINSLYEQIALLDDLDRKIVRLQMDGFSYAEIAAQLDLSEKNVSVKLVRIKEKLRERMNKDY